MSDSGSENESDLDFSASEDEYIPTEEIEDAEDSEISPIKSPKRLKGNIRKVYEDNDDSDSSVENYLVNPNEIDLASEFFNPNQIPISSVPKFDCNVGLNLSDSEEEEVFEDVPSSSREAVTKLDFRHHANFNKQLERDKETLRNLQSTKFGQDNCEDDVSKLLAIGEPSLAATKSSKSKFTQDSEESDFEEVIEDVKSDNKKDVEVRIGPVIKQKPDRLQAEIEASIKRKINRVKKENQLAMHKVHLLSWIAYGNFVNKILNSSSLMEMVLHLMPSKTCYPKEQTDQKYFEQIIKWYKTTVGLKCKEQDCRLKCLPPLSTSLALQIQSKMAICKKDFVYIFIILLRSIGIQCRLVINLATVPIRPPAKELCVISLKSTEKAKTAKKKVVLSGDKSKEKHVSKETKNTKSKSKPDKTKSRASSISGEISNIPTKSSDASYDKKSIKSKLEAALKSTESNSGDKKVLKRTVSVESISSVSNIKRSRVANSIDTTSANMATSSSNEMQSLGNESNVNKLKRRSLSLQSPPLAPKVSRSLSKFVSKMSSKINSAQVISSPVAQRTRRARANSKSTLNGIPQLDGGDNSRRSRQKPQGFILKFPFRSRSVSPTSSSNATSKRSKSVTAEINIGGITKVKSTSISKSPTEHTSRKSRSTTRSSSRDQLPSSSSVNQQNNAKKVRSVSSSKAAAMEVPSTSAVKTSTRNASKEKNVSESTVTGDKATKKVRSASKSRATSSSKVVTMDSSKASSSSVKTSSKTDSKALVVAGDKKTKKVRSSSKSRAIYSSEVVAMESNDSKEKNSSTLTVAGDKTTKKVRSASKSPQRNQTNLYHLPL